MALFSRAFFRRRIISLATSLSVSATSFAFAEDPGHSHRLRTGVGDGNERQFLFASDLAISKVSRAMLTPPSGDVDRDFVAVMMPTTKRPSTWRAPSLDTVMTEHCANWP